MKLPSRYLVQLGLTIVGASAGLAVLLAVLISAGSGRLGRQQIPLRDAFAALPVIFGIVLTVAVFGTWYNNRRR